MKKYIFLWVLVSLCLSFILFAQQPQAPNIAPIAPAFNVKATYVKGPYDPTAAATGLILNIGPGTIFCSGVIVNYAGGTLTMTNSTTNYVYLNMASSCVPTVSTSVFTTNNTPIAKVVTSGGNITAITDDRTWLSGSPGANVFGTPPATPNITFLACDTVSGSVATLGFCWPGTPGRTVSGSSDTIGATDRGSCVLYTNGGAVAVAAPHLGTTNFANNFLFCVKTATTTVATITPTTSTIAGNNGTLGSNLAVPASSTAYCYGWDDTNYQCTVVSPPTGSGVWQACNSRGFQSLSGAIPAGTVTQFSCVNDTGSTVTLTGFHAYCPTGSTTVNAANNAGTALLTGPVTCNSTKASGGAAGTQSGTTTLSNGDAITWTVVFDGTTGELNLNASGNF